MFSLDALKTQPGYDETPDRYPAPGEPRPSLPAADRSPISAKGKAAQWSAAIYRAWRYLSGRVREPAHQVELDAMLEKTLAAGPDFACVRRNATFAPVQVFAYSPKAAAEIMRQAREIERESYATRDKGAHGGGLGRMALQLLEWFCFSLWPKARFGMTPSLAHIAAAARMSRASVVEAQKRLALFGFLAVQRRRKRVETPLGAKVVQNCNAYVLSLARGLGVLALAAFGKKPATSGRKPAVPSEFRRTPSIRNEQSFLMPRCADWLLKPDYEPLME
jgi:hypothetical protein